MRDERVEATDRRECRRGYTGGKRRLIAYGRMPRRGRIFAPMREARAYVEIAREKS